MKRILTPDFGCNDTSLLLSFIQSDARETVTRDELYPIREQYIRP